MQVKYQTYDSYKDSGVPWLGDIPSDWKLIRGKWRHKYKKERNRNNKSDNVLSLTLNGVINNDRDNPIGLSPDDYATYQLFEANNLVFKLIDLENYRTSRVGLVHETGVMSSAYIRIIASPEDNPRYLYYFYYSMYLEGVYNKLGAGVRSTLNQDDLLDLPVLQISKDTQNKIVSFLDAKIEEIDQAITKKEHFIELLREQKSIIINQAVTKGLKPDIPTKDSGVEWIGRIPEHWKIKRAKYLFKEIDERSQIGQEELLSVSHMTGVTPRSEKNIYMFMAEDYSGSKLCRQNDLVFNIMWAWMGALGVSDRTGIVSPSYGVYRQRSRDLFNSWYLEELLRSLPYVTEYNKRSTGLHSSRLRLYSHMFFDMEIALPPIEEQNQIEHATKAKCEVTDDLIEATHKEVDALQEYKQTLVAHAVTGKIKI